MPRGVLKEIESLFVNFIWSSNGRPAGLKEVVSWQAVRLVGDRKCFRNLTDVEVEGATRIAFLGEIGKPRGSKSELCSDGEVTILCIV